jgi:hypothetical protein
MSFNSPEALIGDAIVVAVVGIVAAAVCFAFRPRRWLAVVLLFISLVPAYSSARAVWEHISFARLFGGRYIDHLRTLPGEWLWLLAAVTCVTLSLLWVVICFRLKRADTTT